MSIRDSVAARLRLTIVGGTAVYGASMVAFISQTGLAASHRSALGVLIALSAAAVAGAWVLAVLLARTITRPLDHAIEVLAEIERGNYSTPVDGGSQDEIGRALQGLARTQRALRERAATEWRLATENTRVRSALDRVAVGVMLADPEGKIIYLNESMQTMLRARIGELRKQLPHLDPDRLLGQPLDSLHRLSSHQGGPLADLKGTQTSEFKLGEASLRIIANPVADREGVRVGTVVQWVDRTQELATEDEVRAIVAKAIDGDLTVRISEQGKDAFFKTLAEGINRLLANMADVVRTMSRAAFEVQTGSEEISRGNAELSHRTEEQASSLEETASSMEEMTATVTNNAHNAEQASQLAASAREQAERGGSVVGAAVAAMGEINASSKRIADIITVIDEIAFQTNLLALNAAVEAARAGEHGRGFAVVASEVRSLASRSAEAAKELKTLIQESVGRVTEGTRLVDESGKALGEIVVRVKKVTDVIAEIASSGREQSSGIAQVNKAITVMDDVTQQNAALVEEASAAAQALAEQAANLTQLIGRYQIGERSVDEVARAIPAPAAAAPAVERRSPNRPFSVRKTAAAGIKSPNCAANSAPLDGRKRVAAAADAEEWKDF